LVSRLLILGGTKTSLAIFNDIVVPFLAIAGIDNYEMRQTEYKCHATEMGLI
jgi:hypothetical protein